jgi:hypothetical protein
MMVTSDAQRQLAEHIQLPFLGHDGLDRKVNVPPSPESRRLSEDLLAGLSRASGDDGAGLGIPPQRIPSRVIKETPDALDRRVHGGNWAGAQTRIRHSLILSRKYTNLDVNLANFVILSQR